MSHTIYRIPKTINQQTINQQTNNQREDGVYYDSDQENRDFDSSELEIIKPPPKVHKPQCNPYLDPTDEEEEEEDDFDDESDEEDEEEDDSDDEADDHPHDEEEKQHELAVLFSLICFFFPKFLLVYIFQATITPQAPQQLVNCLVQSDESVSATKVCLFVFFLVSLYCFCCLFCNELSE